MSTVEHGYLHVGIVSRSRGQSVVERAAFNAGALLADGRRECVWDHRFEHELYASFIVAPDGTPSWALDRETLWNAVERAEMRSDAQLARELELSLPSSLNLPEQVELLQTFVGERFVSAGMVADCVIRSPTAPKRHRPSIHPVPGPWALVLLTTRELQPSGFGLKQRSWNERDLKNGTRAAWQRAANQALELADREERIDVEPRRPPPRCAGEQAVR